MDNSKVHRPQIDVKSNWSQPLNLVDLKDLCCRFLYRSGSGCIKTALQSGKRGFARPMRPVREAYLLLDYGSVRFMPIGDRKTLDHYRNRLLRRAEAIQRRLDEVTRAAREELVSINDEIRALDSTRETLEEDGERRANILGRKSVRVKKSVKTVLIVEKTPLHPIVNNANPICWA
jgi:hypothetical protein